MRIAHTWANIALLVGKNKFTASIDSEILFASITDEEIEAHCFLSGMAKGL